MFPIVGGNVKLGYTEGRTRKYNIHQLREEVLVAPLPLDDELPPNQPATVDRTDYLESAAGNLEQHAGGHTEHVPSCDPASSIDFCSLPDDVLIRHRRLPRLNQVSFNEDGLRNPVPIRDIEVMRSTETPMDNIQETRIHDVCIKDQKTFLNIWT